MSDAKTRALLRATRDHVQAKVDRAVRDQPTAVFRAPEVRVENRVPVPEVNVHPEVRAPDVYNEVNLPEQPITVDTLPLAQALDRMTVTMAEGLHALSIQNEQVLAQLALTNERLTQFIGVLARQVPPTVVVEAAKPTTIPPPAVEPQLVLPAALVELLQKVLAAKPAPVVTRPDRIVDFHLNKNGLPDRATIRDRN